MNHLINLTQPERDVLIDALAELQKSRTHVRGLPLQPLSDKIAVVIASWDELRRAQQDHPDYVGGTLWTREDVAAALFGDEDDDDFPNASEENIARVTEEQMNVARHVTDHWVTSEGWHDTIRSEVTF